MKIGIDIGGSHIAIGLINEDKILSLKEKNFTNEDRKDLEKCILEYIYIFIDDILNQYRIKISDIKLIGISAPGLIEDGYIKRARNLNIYDFNISKILTQKYNIKVIVRNDAKCASLAEKKYGAMKNYKDCVFLSIGTGIGGAAYINGNLLQPNKCSGFEFGHMVLQKDGRQCKCGKKGCFETYASIKALKQKVTKDLGMDDDITGQYLREKILVKDIPEVKQDIEEFLDYMKLGICNLIDIFEPEIVCLGGSFAYYESNPILDRLMEKLKQPNSTFNGIIPKIVLAEFKNNAGIIGATII